MTKQQIENEINPMFSDVMCVGIEDIDKSSPLFAQHGIDELDIFELLSLVDDEFGTNLWDNIDAYKVSLEDIVTLVEIEINK